MQVDPSWDEERNRRADVHAAFLYEIADTFQNVYVIDLRKYGPIYDKEFKDAFFYNNHMTPCGYMFTAKMFMSYIDYLIRHHMNDFKLAGMIGRGRRLDEYIERNK